MHILHICIFKYLIDADFFLGLENDSLSPSIYVFNAGEIEEKT